jgi:uncharacterized protein
VIAVDTNILVYSHRTDTQWHDTAKAHVKALAEGRGQWAIPWPCIHEFLSITTNPKLYAPATPLSVAFVQIREWLNSGSVSLLHDGPLHVETLMKLSQAASLRGPQIHDARIAAICLDHGISELWTADRDSSRFPALQTRNPLVA